MNTREPWEVVDGRAMAVFEIYIKTTPERLWEAITDSELRQKYNFGVGVSSDWTPGSAYSSGVPGVVEIAAGENVEVEPPRRLVQTFQALWSEDVKAAGTSRVSWEIEPVGDSCRLLVTHDQLPEGANSELFGGWPMILSGLKTLLETGELLTTPGSLRYAGAATSGVPEAQPLTGSRASASTVWAQARAASAPFSRRCAAKKARWVSCSWKWWGVRTAEIVGTPLSSWTRISPPITASATNSWR